MNGNWGFGTTVMFLNSGQVTYDAPEILNLCKDSTLKVKYMSDPKFAFTLETYANDTPAPNILPRKRIAFSSHTDPLLQANKQRFVPINID